jgi:hypothetical protein
MPTDSPALESDFTPRDFRTTHWSIVLRARRGDSAESAAALEALCRGYWLPLYAFVRRKGFEPADAEDFTQAFFERLLERNYLEQVSPEKGRYGARWLRRLAGGTLRLELENRSPKTEARKKSEIRTRQELLSVSACNNRISIARCARRRSDLGVRA